MKKCKTFLFLALLIISYTAEGQIIDKIVGHVGGEIILYSDVQKSVSYMKDSGWPDDESTYCLVVEDLLMRKLLINQAKLDSVLVLDVEIDAQLDARITQILRQMGNDETRFEHTYKKTVDEVKRDMREQMKNQMLFDRMQGTIMEQVEATPSEVIDYYNNIPKDSLPYFNSEVEISEVVYNIPHSEEERQRALDKINNLREQVLAGEDFGELAKKFSDDRGSAQYGGDMGMQPRGTFVPEFEAAAYNLEIGEVSEVVETMFGYHIIKLLKRQGNMIQVQHILITPNLKVEDVEKGKRLLDSLKKLVEIDSISFEYVVRFYGDDNERSYSNAGRMMNPQTGNNFFEVGDLDSEVYFAISELEEGEISNPIEFNQIGRDVRLKLFFLHSRTKPHQANLELDYNRIRNLATQQKRIKKFEEWMQKRIPRTYIKLDENFLVCEGIETWIHD